MCMTYILSGWLGGMLARQRAITLPIFQSLGLWLRLTQWKKWFCMRAYFVQDSEISTFYHTQPATISKQAFQRQTLNFRARLNA